MERRERVISNNVSATCNSRWKHNLANILYAPTAYAIMCKWKLQVTARYCLVHVSNFDQVTWTTCSFITFSDTPVSQSPCWSTQIILWWLRKKVLFTSLCTNAGGYFSWVCIYDFTCVFQTLTNKWQTFEMAVCIHAQRCKKHFLSVTANTLILCTSTWLPWHGSIRMCNGLAGDVPCTWHRFPRRPTRQRRWPKALKLVRGRPKPRIPVYTWQIP